MSGEYALNRIEIAMRDQKPGKGIFTEQRNRRDAYNLWFERQDPEFQALMKEWWKENIHHGRLANPDSDFLTGGAVEEGLKKIREADAAKKSLDDIKKKKKAKKAQDDIKEKYKDKPGFIESISKKTDDTSTASYNKYRDISAKAEPGSEPVKFNEWKETRNEWRSNSNIQQQTGATIGDKGKIAAHAGLADNLPTSTKPGPEHGLPDAREVTQLLEKQFDRPVPSDDIIPDFRKLTTTEIKSIERLRSEIGIRERLYTPPKQQIWKPIYDIKPKTKLTQKLKDPRQDLKLRQETKPRTKIRTDLEDLTAMKPLLKIDQPLRLKEDLLVDLAPPKLKLDTPVRLDIGPKLDLKLRPKTDIPLKLKQEPVLKLDTPLKLEPSSRLDLQTKLETPLKLTPQQLRLRPDLQLKTKQIQVPKYRIDDLRLTDPNLRLRYYQDLPPRRRPTRGRTVPRTVPKTIGGVPFWPFGGGGLGGAGVRGTKTGIFAREITRDIGDLSIMGKKGIFSDMVGRVKKK